jgi:hypothetical protein
VQLGRLRGRPRRFGASVLIVSCHPAYVLRLPDPQRRTEARANLLEDLRAARELLDGGVREMISYVPTFPGLG